MSDHPDHRVAVLRSTDPLDPDLEERVNERIAEEAEDGYTLVDTEITSYADSFDSSTYQSTKVLLTFKREGLRESLSEPSLRREDAMSETPSGEVDPWWDCPKCGSPTRVCNGPRLPTKRECSDCDWSFTFPEMGGRDE